MIKIAGFDELFNVPQLVVAYQHDGGERQALTYQTEGAVRFARLGLALRATALASPASGGHFRVGGVGLQQSLGAGGTFSLELPVSSGQMPDDVRHEGAARYDGSALRANLERAFRDRVTLQASHERIDRGFVNPYGATLIPEIGRAHV